MFLNDDTRPLLLSEAASYAENWGGDTVDRFKLSHADLMELATSLAGCCKSRAQARTGAPASF